MKRTGVAEFFALLFLAVVWELVGRLVKVDWLPPFSVVIGHTVALFRNGVLPGALAASASGFLIGYGLSVVIGVSLGFAMAVSKLARWALGPYVYAALVVPPVAMAPVFFAIFGLSANSVIAVITLFAAPIVIVNVQTGVDEVDGHLLEMARSFRAGHLQMFWRVVWPGALPQVMAGLRLGLTRAIKGMIVGQLMLSVFGIGRLADVYADTFDASGALAVALVTVVLALVAVGLLQIVEARSWKGRQHEVRA